MSRIFRQKDLCDEQLLRQESSGEAGDAKDGDAQNPAAGETDSFPELQAVAPCGRGPDSFPEITEALIATYQANYGFSESTSNAQDTGVNTAGEPLQREVSETADPRKRGEKRKNSGWFHVEEDKNTNVYVSGMPPDITVGEFTQLMSKFGIIMRDPQTEEFKIKLYKDNKGNLKGDGLCCYLRKESVELAVKLLDEDKIRGYKLHVEVAKFQLKGEYDVSKKKKQCKDYRKKLSLQQKQLDWRPERKAGPSRMSHERVVIIKNMFHPTDFDDEPLVLNEIREDLRVECSKFGQVRKLLVFDRHPDGVASVSFRRPEEADCCIQTLDKRWFGGRQISAQAWDGTTDYLVEETCKEREERMRGWDAFLNAPEANRDCQNSNSTSESVGQCRIKHFSGHISKSEINLQETATGTSFEGFTEKKVENSEDGGELDEHISGKDLKEYKHEKQAKQNLIEREFKPASPEIQSNGSQLKNEHEKCYPRKEAVKEDIAKTDMQDNVPEREYLKRAKDDENGPLKVSHGDESSKDSTDEESLNKGSEEESPERTSDEDCPAGQSERSFEKEFEVNRFERDFARHRSDRDLLKDENLFENVLEEHDTHSEFAEAPGRVLKEGGSERESGEYAKEKEDVCGKVPDAKPKEVEDEDEAEKECDDAGGKEKDDDENLFPSQDKKEDTDQKNNGDNEENLSKDENSSEKSCHEKVVSTEKYSGDFVEKEPVANVREDGSQPIDDIFVLNNNDRANEI
uniref:HIV Tat-specific factor 1-like n=1 Tax=Jaculus jaculus TaxID=51337 RepID=UPI001E1B23A0|nr:HIV Tat-specific factor 1-like [Jaculus jaculus]